VPIIVTTEITSITETTAKSGGSITSDEGESVLSRGVCWSINPNPTINDTKTIDGVGGGIFESNITNLYGGTSYFIRAYATNSYGTGYGMALSFKTIGEPPSSPVVKTENITSLGQYNSTINGIVNAKYYPATVSFEYGTTKSYGYNIPANPTMVEGNRNIAVSATLSGLFAETVYHYRVKAVNSLGTSYGNNLIFKTFISNYNISRIDTINNTRYLGQTYYVIGFLFPAGQKFSTLSSPKPDIIVDSNGNDVLFMTDNLQNSFNKYGEYSDAITAKNAYDNLTLATVNKWEGQALQIKANQIWIFRDGTGKYTKIRVISVVKEPRAGQDYAECTFEWMHQPNGTLSFPSK